MEEGVSWKEDLKILNIQGRKSKCNSSFVPDSSFTYFHPQHQSHASINETENELFKKLIYLLKSKSSLNAIYNFSIFIEKSFLKVSDNGTDAVFSVFTLPPLLKPNYLLSI